MKNISILDAVKDNKLNSIKEYFGYTINTNFFTEKFYSEKIPEDIFCYTNNESFFLKKYNSIISKDKKVFNISNYLGLLFNFIVFVSLFYYFDLQQVILNKEKILLSLGIIIFSFLIFCSFQFLLKIFFIDLYLSYYYQEFTTNRYKELHTEIINNILKNQFNELLSLSNFNNSLVLESFENAFKNNIAEDEIETYIKNYINRKSSYSY